MKETQKMFDGLLFWVTIVFELVVNAVPFSKRRRIYPKLILNSSLRKPRCMGPITPACCRRICTHCWLGAPRTDLYTPCPAAIYSSQVLRGGTWDPRRVSHRYCVAAIGCLAPGIPAGCPISAKPFPASTHSSQSPAPTRPPPPTPYTAAG